MLANFLKQSWLVMLAALVFGLLVAAVNGALEQRIEENARIKLFSKMENLLNDPNTIEEVADEESEEIEYWVAKDPARKIMGYAVKASGGGFADKIVLLVAFNSDLTMLRGIAVLSSQETPGFGDKIKHDSTEGKISYKDQYRGCPLEAKLVLIKTGDPSLADDQIVAISGATISSEAVLSIVNQALETMRENLEP